MINVTFHIYLSHILRMTITRDSGLFLKQDCWKHLLMHGGEISLKFQFEWKWIKYLAKQEEFDSSGSSVGLMSQDVSMWPWGEINLSKYMLPLSHCPWLSILVSLGEAAQICPESVKIDLHYKGKTALMRLMVCKDVCVNCNLLLRLHSKSCWEIQIRCSSTGENVPTDVTRLNDGGGSWVSTYWSLKITENCTEMKKS